MLVRSNGVLAAADEWVYRTQMGNFAGIKKLLDKGVIYYCIVHHHAPAHAQAPPFSAKVMAGQKGVFERLDNEMARMQGHIGAISPTFLGDKLDDLQARRALAAEEDAQLEHAGGDEGEGQAEQREIARQAYKMSVEWDSGAPGDGPDISVLSFVGRWLPLGEQPKRMGELVICCRGVQRARLEPPICTSSTVSPCLVPCVSHIHCSTPAVDNRNNWLEVCEQATREWRRETFGVAHHRPPDSRILLRHASARGPALGTRPRRAVGALRTERFVKVESATALRIGIWVWHGARVTLLSTAARLSDFACRRRILHVHLDPCLGRKKLVNHASVHIVILTYF